MMAAAAAAAAASGGPPPPIPPQNAADTLRTFLSGNNRPNQWTQPVESPPPNNQLHAQPVAKKRKIIYQVFKDPLVVSNHQKIGHVPNGKGPIVYKEVSDPADNDNTYMMCGECDSLRLFRNLTSLYKHRLKDCCEVGETVVEEQPSITCMAKEARQFLNQLSLDELVTEFKHIYPGQTPPTTKENLVESILKHAMGDPGEEPESVQPEILVQNCADIPPLCVIDSALMYMGLLWPRLHAIAQTNPHVSPLILAVSAITECDPILNKRRLFDAENQTRIIRLQAQTLTGIVLVNSEELMLCEKETQCEGLVSKSPKKRQSLNSKTAKITVQNVPRARRSSRLRRRE